MFNIKEEIKKLPEKSGVYIMKDSSDNIIYIGKAINLKNRVRQYFGNNKNQNVKVSSMVKHISEFEYIVTDTEMEALILECNLIKIHKPHYNIMLKDDKSYPYIKVTINEDFPRIFITRKYIRDKSKYFGPITDSSLAKETIDIIHKIFPIRKCNKVFSKNKINERPCLNYHIGQCLAPCNGMIKKEEYRKYIDEAIMIIEGKNNDLIKKMHLEMEALSKELNFEKAALLRDKINIIKSISKRQKMDNTNLGDCDVIAFSSKSNDALFQIFFIRAGKMTGREHFLIEKVYNIDESELMTDFIKQFYSGTAFIPKEILVQYDLIECEKKILENYFSNLRGNKVTINKPLKGEKLSIVQLAYKNCVIEFEQILDRIKKEYQKTIGAMQEISDILGIDKNILRLEAYDISNTQGFESVGSMVVFENGKPKKSDYRKFKIRTVIGANDYASIKEVLNRRFKNAFKKNEAFSKLPDLIMIDGGNIQISAVREVLYNFNLDIPVCGMIKDDRHKTKGIIYKNNEIYMPLNSQGFLLITRIQDEVHRFAIEYHKKLRDKKDFHSILDDIYGVGDKRKKALIKHFGSVENIKKADISQLKSVEGMNIKSAKSVHDFFRKL